MSDLQSAAPEEPTPPSSFLSRLWSTFSAAFWSLFAASLLMSALMPRLVHGLPVRAEYRRSILASLPPQLQHVAQGVVLRYSDLEDTPGGPDCFTAALVTPPQVVIGVSLDGDFTLRPESMPRYCLRHELGHVVDASGFPWLVTRSAAFRSAFPAALSDYLEEPCRYVVPQPAYCRMSEAFSELWRWSEATGDRWDAIEVYAEFYSLDPDEIPPSIRRLVNWPAWR